MLGGAKQAVADGGKSASPPQVTTPRRGRGILQSLSPKGAPEAAPEAGVSSWDHGELRGEQGAEELTHDIG